MTLVEEIQKAGIADGFGSPYVGGYHMQQNPEEFAQLIEALQNYTLSTYLQVGSAAGGAERFICEKTGIKDLTIIDLGTHPEFHVWQKVNRPALESQGVKVTQYLGDSHEEGAEEFLAQYGKKYDLIGIDGDHTPAGARMDWKLIEPCLKPGALVWLHDTHAEHMRPCDQGGWEVFSKLMERHKVILDVREVFGIGMVEIV